MSVQRSDDSLSFRKAAGVSLFFHGILISCLLVWGPVAPVDKLPEITTMEVDIIPARIVDRGDLAQISSGQPTQTHTSRMVADPSQAAVSRPEPLPHAVQGDANETSVVKPISTGIATASVGAVPVSSGTGKVEAAVVGVDKDSGLKGEAGVQTTASCLYSPEPTYPQVARKAGWEGVVLVRALIAADGSVATVSVRDGSGCDILDEAALNSVRKWRFSPAQRGGVPITSFYDVKVRFRLLDAG